jgi:hypothetical protein
VLGFLAYDPVDDRWLRLSFDSVTSTADFETSPDGVMWTAFHTESVPGFAFDGARAIYGAGVWEGPYVDDAFAVVDNAFMCG